MMKLSTIASLMARLGTCVFTMVQCRLQLVSYADPIMNVLFDLTDALRDATERGHRGGTKPRWRTTI